MILRCFVGATVGEVSVPDVVARALHSPIIAQAARLGARIRHRCSHFPVCIDTGAPTVLLFYVVCATVSAVGSSSKSQAATRFLGTSPS